MKLRFLGLTLGCLAITACGILAPNGPKKEAEAPATIRLTLLPQSELVKGKPVTVLAKLNNIQNRYLFIDSDLETVHTRTIHLLVIDPTLTDYQHIHPEPTATPGLYSFTFTPKLSGGYRVWADITPKTTGKEEFDIANLGAPRAGTIDKTETREATVDGYHFALSFDIPPKVNGESMGTIKVTDRQGNPVTSLEPIMGAYAHIAGFYDDFRSVAHIHPMGAEPKAATDRGGPEFTFHFAPYKAGFVKLFVQVKIAGKDIFVPFGVRVVEEKK